MGGIMSGTEAAPTDNAEAKVLEFYAVRQDKALATIFLLVDPSLLYLA